MKAKARGLKHLKQSRCYFAKSWSLLTLSSEVFNINWYKKKDTTTYGSRFVWAENSLAAKETVLLPCRFKDHSV